MTQAQFENFDFTQGNKNTCNSMVDNLNPKIKSNNFITKKAINIKMNALPVKCQRVEKMPKNDLSNFKREIKKKDSSKIIYRVLHPEELRLTEKKYIEESEEKSINIKIKETNLAKDLKNLSSKLQNSKSKQTNVLSKTSNFISNDKFENQKELSVAKSFRTRSGRITKPPRYFKQVC